ncbi:MAG: DUF1552 domain-containing protein [Nannocystaceae bacterium]
MNRSRRRFLGGAATLIALPTLEALTPRAEAADQAEPRRLLAYYVPNGMPMDAWTPTSTAPGFTLPPVLSPLEALREQLVVVSGLRNAPADIDSAGHHAAGTAGFLTAARARRSESQPLVGISIDQLFARHHGGDTPIDSLQLGLQGGDGVGNCDNGFSCAYSRNISWSSPTTPRPKIVSPRLAFERMFHGDDPDATAIERARRRQRRHSVLDHVRDQASALRLELGGRDRDKLDEYFEAVRDVERRIDRAADHSCDTAELDDRLVHEPVDMLEHLSLMHELMVLALRCDATRAITFMLGNSASNRSFEWLGIAEGHHDLSHHAGDPAAREALQRVSTWEVEQFADLLRRLAEVPAGEGTLLDHCVVLLSSELADGNMHTHDDLPTVVAGRAGGALTTGRHVRAEGRPWGELLHSVLTALDVPVEQVGEDGHAPLAGL